MFKKVLCATDGSHSAEKAIDLATRWAKATGAELTFIAISTVSAESAAHTHFWDTRLLAAGDAMMHAELARAHTAAESAGVAAQCVVASGRDIATAVVEYADAHGHDHIVVGTAGRVGLERLVLGSVAADIVAHARCPVTVAR